MTMFEDRKNAFEAKFRLDQEARFKIGVRRNKLLGLWAAARMGLSSPIAEDYAKEVVAADFDRPGDDDVLEKVLADLTAKGLDVTNSQVREKMNELAGTAREQVIGGPGN